MNSLAKDDSSPKCNNFKEDVRSKIIRYVGEMKMKKLTIYYLINCQSFIFD
jgi:hypothetical protein